MNHPENQYLSTLQDIIDNGESVPNRTGIDTIRTLGVMHKYNFEDGFPLFTTKNTWFKGIVHELLWMLSGDTDIKYLVDNGVNIWNSDAYRHYLNSAHSGNRGAVRPMDKDHFIAAVKNGSVPGGLGNVYGKQWRSWDGKIDQIEVLIKNLKKNPFSRRHILSAWNVSDLDKMSLPPCHFSSIFSVDKKNKLHCLFNMRSSDLALGLPFNVASYALLTHMIAQVTGYQPGSVTYSGWDAHVYENQIPGVTEQLKRKPYPFPKLWLNHNIKNIDDFKFEDIKITDYKCHPKIDMPLST